MKEETLDPTDWKAQRALGHRMLDEMFDYLQNVRERGQWQPPTEAVKAYYDAPLPLVPTPEAQLFEEFKTFLLPFNKGNVHPGFWGWVQGTGTSWGMLADMLASGMNPNVTIGNQAAMLLDAQVISWCKTLMGFPESGSGMLVSGGSMANITALNVARNSFEGQIRAKGLHAQPKQLRVYASTETHSCVQKAVEVIGLGNENYVRIPVNARFELDLEALRNQIASDKAEGLLPFCIVANCGTVNTGAIDPLADLRELCNQENIWLHIDGAFGAAVHLLPEYQHLTHTISQADSLAFDLHKWFYVNYEVGCVLFQNKNFHREAFAQAPAYLLTHEAGLASGPENLSNYGLELSRGFKALKVWMSFKSEGIEKYSRLIRQNIAQVQYMKGLIDASSELERLADVPMNILCFRYVPVNNHFSQEALNALNKQVLMALHATGKLLPTFTILKGSYVIRVAHVNHRSQKQDFDLLFAETIRLGRELSSQG